MAGYSGRHRHIYPELESRYPDSPYKSPLLLYRNLGHGHFEELFDEAGTAILEPHSSRGMAFGDFDNDGDIDMLVVNLGDRPRCSGTTSPKKSLDQNQARRHSLQSLGNRRAH